MTLGKATEGCHPIALPTSGVTSLMIWNGGQNGSSLQSPYERNCLLDLGLLDHEGPENLIKSTVHSPGNSGL